MALWHRLSVRNAVACECRCSFICAHVTLCHPMRPLSYVICLCSTLRPDSALIYCSNGIAFYYDLIWACPPESEERLNTCDWLLIKSRDSGHHFAVNKYPHIHILSYVTVGVLFSARLLLNWQSITLTQLNLNAKDRSSNKWFILSLSPLALSF